VGQYQHDVNQKELKKSLELVVESCVNYVGVELSTASCELLSYVSGINKTVAENIIKYRSQNSVLKPAGSSKIYLVLAPGYLSSARGFCAYAAASIRWIIPLSIRRPIILWKRWQRIRRLL